MTTPKTSAVILRFPTKFYPRRECEIRVVSSREPPPTGTFSPPLPYPAPASPPSPAPRKPEASE